MQDFILRLTIELFKKYNLLNNEQEQRNFKKFVNDFLTPQKTGSNNLFKTHLIVLNYFYILNKYLSVLKEIKVSPEFRIAENIFVVALILSNKVQEDTPIWISDFFPHYNNSIIKEIECFEFTNLFRHLESEFLKIINFDTLGFNLYFNEIENFAHLKESIFSLLNDDDLEKKFQDEKIPEHSEVISKLIPELTGLLNKKNEFLGEIEGFRGLIEEVEEIGKSTISWGDYNLEGEFFGLAKSFVISISNFLTKMSVSLLTALDLSAVTNLKMMMRKFKNSDQQADLLLDQLELFFTHFMDILAKEKRYEIPLVFFKIYELLLDENNPIPPQGVRQSFYTHLLKQKFWEKENGSILHLLASKKNNMGELSETAKEQLEDLLIFIKENYSKDEANKLLDLENNFGQTYKALLELPVFDDDFSIIDDDSKEILPDDPEEKWRPDLLSMSFFTPSIDKEDYKKLEELVIQPPTPALI